MGSQQLEAERQGWRFTVEEVSAGVYKVTAVDPKGRSVSTPCPELQLATTIESVAADALQLAGGLPR